MSVLDIVNYGDPILRKKCAPVKDFSILKNILDDMFDSMNEAEGIGLAANQVGLNLNLFIIDISHTAEADEPFVFINPEIISMDGDKNIFTEGCLSFPGITLDVSRPEKVTLKYQTVDEIWHHEEFSGLLSRAIQHEMDHLNGIYFIDRVSKIDKMQYKKELLNIESNYLKKQSLEHTRGMKRFVL